ncbi:MAG: DNA polymerase III subunit gamma/tau [Pseudomonadota bacterium]
MEEMPLPTDNESPAGKADSEYRVLARKYRPKDFSDLIGQDAMVRTLSNAFETGRIAQAYMLTGVRGVGKTTTARILARALNFETETVKEPSIELADESMHCRAIMEGRHQDVIEMDAASNTGIDDIRGIIESAQYFPVSARYKVFVIDEVHMLSKAAFNGLLKTLEEPPAHVKFIFATTEIRKVPVTVLSRCQRFDLRRIDSDLMAAHLKKISALEKFGIEDEAAALIARAGEGSVRDALSILDQAIAHADKTVEASAVRDMLGLADRARIIDLFEQVLSGDVAAAMGELRAQYEVGADPAIVLADLAGFTHFVTRLKFVADAAQDASITETERTRGTKFAEALSVRVLGRAWQTLLKGGREVAMARDPLAAAEMVLVRMAHATDLPGPEEAIERLKHLAKQPTTSATPGGQTSVSGPSGTVTAIAPMPQAPSQPQPAMDPGSPVLSDGPMAVAAQAEPDQMDSKAQAAQPPSAVLAVSNVTDVSLGSAADTPDLSKYGTLDALVKLAESHRDLRVKNALRNDLRIVDLSPPNLTFSLAEGADHRIVQLLMERLQKWTGARWIIAVSQEEGAPTLAETDARSKSERMADAEANPAVHAVLKAFPGARVVDVRLREALQEGATTDDEFPTNPEEPDDIEDGLND